MKISIILFILTLITGINFYTPDAIKRPPTKAVEQTILGDSIINDPVVNSKVPVREENSPLSFEREEETQISLSGGMATPTVVAGKTDALIGIDNGPSGPSPGDTIRYTVEISNSGMDATAVKFQDVIDANTTLVAASVKSSPIAIDDNYQTAGNISISVPAASGLLVNDVDLDSDGLTVTAVNTTGTQGEVTFAADGSFTFNPTAGYEGTTTFTYTVFDGTFSRMGTVSIQIAGMIWFINASAPAGGDGRLGSPFNSIANFNGTASDDVGDNIFLYTGAYSGALTLLNNQKLIGQGAVGTLATLAGVTFSTFSPISPATIPLVGGTNPTWTHNMTSVTLGQNNHVLGLTINNSGGTTLNGGSIGNLRIRQVMLSNTSGTALNLSNGVLDVILQSVSSSSASYGMRISSTTGSLEITGTGTTDGSGGTFSNISIRGIEIITATNITLRNLTLTNANTADAGFDGVCDEDDNTACNAAVYLSGVNTVTLNNVDIATTEEHGINGNNVTNLILTNCTATANGNHNEENALKLRDLFGTSSITNCNFSMSAFRIAHIVNTSGNLMLNISNSTFNNTVHSIIGADCLEIRTQGSASATVNITGSSFQRAGSKGIQAIAEGSSTFNLNITGCNIERFGNPMAGIEVGSVGTAVMNYNVNNNPKIEASQEVALLANTFASSTLNGRANNNASITQNSPAATTFSNIRILHEQSSKIKQEIKNNPLVSSTNLDIPVLGLSRFGTNVAHRMDLILDGNVISNTGSSLEGIELRVGTSSMGTAINTLCGFVTRNSVTVPVDTPAIRAFRARIIDPTGFLNLQGSGPDVPSNWTGNSNTNSMGSTVISFATAPAMITFGGSCPAPSHDLPPPPPPSLGGEHDLVQVESELSTVHLEEIPVVSRLETDSDLPMVLLSGETVMVGGSGFPLPANKSITIQFDVEIDDPFPSGICQVSNQGTVSGSNFSNVLTDDPDVSGSSNPTVTVIQIAPVITVCQENLISGTDDDACTASLSFSATATGCPMPTLTYKIETTTITSPHDFALGLTTVTVIASNGVAPNDTCAFTVTVTDDQAPQLTCAAGIQLRNTDMGFCTYTVQGTELDPMVDENCPGYSLTNNFNNAASLAGATLPEGETVVIWTITDGANQMSTCTLTVDVDDMEAPEMTCPGPLMTPCNIDHLAPYTSLTEFVMAGGSVSDNCALNTASFTLMSQTGGPMMFTRIYKIEDENGNSATCMQQVTVNDMEDPMVTAGTIGPCFASEAAAEAAAIAATSAIDNCMGTLTYTAETTGDCDAQITVTVKDQAGNEASVMYNTRIDGMMPMITSGSIASCYKSVAEAEMAALATTMVSDNCSGMITKSASTTGTCSATITVTATDGCGNQASVMYSTRIDNTDPELTAGTIGSCYASSSAAAAAAVAATTAVDNCPGTVTLIATVDGTCQATITVTGTDQCGNSAQVMYQTKIDGEMPMVTQGSINPSYPTKAAAEQAALDATTAIDNCPGTLTENVLSTGECTLLITVTFSDGCGNQNTATYQTSIDIAGEISGDATICAGEIPGEIVETAASTGTGTLTYQWQQSSTGCAGTFSNIDLATMTSYQPEALNETTSYRRIVTSQTGMESCNDTSNCVTITVNAISAGTITGQDTVCFGYSPGTLTESAPAMGTGLTYQWQESTGGCSSNFVDILNANSSTYTPPALSNTVAYRRIVISELNNVICRDTSNCLEVVVSRISLVSVNQVCIDPQSYDLFICIDTLNINPAHKVLIRVDGVDFGPFSFSEFDAEGCISITDNSFIHTDLETFDVLVFEVDGMNNELCSDTVSFTETVCFQCPLVGSVMAPAQICSHLSMNLVASGLSLMDEVQNGETDFGIRFVAFPGGVPADPYNGGNSLGVVSFASLENGNSQAILNNVSGSMLGTPGNYTICAILDPAPLLDVTCRPFASASILVKSIPSQPGAIQGPAVLCPGMINLNYTVDPVPGATEYTWSFSSPSGSITGNGNKHVKISFDQTFTGGTLSVTASNDCGMSIERNLMISLASESFCEIVSCLSENQNLTITDVMLTQLGSPDVYQAINRLTSNATIEDIRNITFKAGNEIHLTPPFQVELGATFIAEIETCILSVNKD